MRSGGNVSIRVVRLVHAVGQPRGGALLGLAISTGQSVELENPKLILKLDGSLIGKFSKFVRVVAHQNFILCKAE